MYGVVLWSDNVRHRAVIWCEDHRTLAFFNDETADGREYIGFEPGDLVEFDLREENDMRLAIDPHLVKPYGYPTLASDLRSACAGKARDEMPPPRKPGPARGGDDRRVVILHPNNRRDDAGGSPAERSYG